MKAIDRSGLSTAFEQDEQYKSNLILEANMLKAQGQYTQASQRFALAAEIEERLARELRQLGNRDKAFHHAFSAVSCWAQAGDLYRAQTSGMDLLSQVDLSANNRERLETFLQTLSKQTVEWMKQWQSGAVTAD